MKADSRGNIEMVMFPYEECSNVMAAMKKYETLGCLPGLQWCARRMELLFEMFGEDTLDTDTVYVKPKMFNKIWELALKTDPVPEALK